MTPPELRKQILSSSKHLTMIEDRTRIVHQGCSSSGYSQNLSISRTKDGLVYYCFKCMIKGFIKDESHWTPPSLRTPAPPKAIPTNAAYQPINWHPPTREWVQRYLSDTEIKNSGLCVYNQTLYIPIHADQFIYRVFNDDWDGPKWCSVGAPQYYARADGYSKPTSAILTEDCISAICCARVSHSYALLGTRLMPTLRTVLLRGGYKSVYLWLDNDNSPVRMNVNKTANELRLFIPKVYIIRKQIDPKEVPPKDMIDILAEASHD